MDRQPRRWYERWGGAVTGCPLHSPRPIRQPLGSWPVKKGRHRRFEEARKLKQQGPGAFLPSEPQRPQTRHEAEEPTTSSATSPRSTGRSTTTTSPTTRRDLRVSLGLAGGRAWVSGAAARRGLRAGDGRIGVLVLGVAVVALVLGAVTAVGTLTRRGAATPPPSAAPAPTTPTTEAPGTAAATTERHGRRPPRRRRRLRPRRPRQPPARRRPGSPSTRTAASAPGSTSSTGRSPTPAASRRSDPT